MSGFKSRGEKSNRQSALIFSGLLLFIGMLTAWRATLQTEGGYITMLIIPFASVGLYYLLTRKYRRILATAKGPIPKEWHKLLQEDVEFYQALSTDEQAEYLKRVQRFLAEIKITGVNVDVSERDRLLVASCAVIPFWEIPQWDYGDLREVLLYSGSFDSEFQTGKYKHILGMVGEQGFADHVMLLSKPTLIHGFTNPEDKKNVGFHEFAHLLDKLDGRIDGIPAYNIPQEMIEEWESLMHKEWELIQKRKSDINPYALTNEAEFFAVTSEYYLEQPELFQRKHPELYNILGNIYS